MIGRLVDQVISSLGDGRIKFSVLYLGRRLVDLVDQMTSSLGDGRIKFSVIPQSPTLINYRKPYSAIT